MLQIINLEQEHLIAAKISGKLTEKDMEKMHPLIHNIIEKGHKVDFYFVMEDFEGYTIKGFWEDLKIDSAHLGDYGKMAFVGNKKWQEWAAKATDFFIKSEVKFFDSKNKEQAMTWVSTKG
nr:STAS/SEC14 domain-containing protein [Muricauda sp. UBA7809]|tara:strand:+ start:1629 stop:1991 length:363 start_codon:yes stop_codon:yes gene_type:complete